MVIHAAAELAAAVAKPLGYTENQGKPTGGDTAEGDHECEPSGVVMWPVRSHASGKKEDSATGDPGEEDTAASAQKRTCVLFSGRGCLLC